MEYECGNNGMAHDHTAKFHNKTTADHMGQIAIEAEAKANEKTDRTKWCVERVHAGTSEETDYQ